MSDKVYVDSPNDIFFPYIIQDVVEEKSGKPIQVVERNYLSDNIEYREKMLYQLLDEEFKIEWDDS